MGLKDIQPTQHDEPPHWDFSDAAHEVFPTGTSGRLARALEVNQRLVQRWLANEIPPTQRAIEFVEQQQKALTGIFPREDLAQIVQRWHDSGVHIEVIACHIAALYNELIGRNIE